MEFKQPTWYILTITTLENPKNGISNDKTENIKKLNVFVSTCTIMICLEETDKIEKLAAGGNLDDLKYFKWITLLF